MAKKLNSRSVYVTWFLFSIVFVLIIGFIVNESFLSEEIDLSPSEEGFGEFVPGFCCLNKCYQVTRYCGKAICETNQFECTYEGQSRVRCIPETEVETDRDDCVPIGEVICVPKFVGECQIVPGLDPSIS